MDRRLIHPGWLAAHLVVLVIAVLFVRLGMWQLDRLDERRSVNSVIADRFTKEPVEFESLERSDPQDIEYRRVTVSGRALTDAEILIRSQVHRGVSGSHLVLPVSHRGGGAVLVNRGWVPLDTDVGSVDHGLDPQHELSISGWIHRSQERRGLGPEDPADGVLTVMSRVDIDRVQQQVDPRLELADVYIVEIGELGSGPPFAAGPPDFEDDGPHLGYAIQWFGFTVILVVGWYFLARQRLRAQVASKGLARSSTTS